MALNNEFKVKNSLNTLGQILSSGVDIASIFAPSNTSWTLTAGDQGFNISGTETLTLQGGNGVSVRALSATETVSISGINATSTVRGVASFVSDDFTVTDGAVSIKTGGVDNDQLKTATTENIANNVVIRDSSGGFRAGTVTVTGDVSASGHLYAPTIIGPGGNSNQWDIAYDTAVSYQNLSAGFALSGYNTTIADSVSSIQVGGASPAPASLWKQRTIIQVLDSMLFPDLTASYTIPTINFSSSTSTQVEVGTIISPQFSVTFTENDAGPLSAVYYQRNPLSTSFTTLSTVVSPASGAATNVADQFGYPNPNSPNASWTLTFTDSSYSVPDGATVWRGVADYFSGLPKRNNKGVVDTRPLSVRLTSNPQLSSAGFQSGTVTVTGRRRVFFSNDNVTTAPTDSTAVRNLTGSIGSGGTWLADGSVFNIPITPGTKRVVFAYPTSFNPVQTVIDQGSQLNVTLDFTLTTVSVSGANNLSPVNYNVYTYVATGVFQSATTYTVTI
jgi:hypothetical protein